MGANFPLFSLPMSPTYRLETLRRLRMSALDEAQADLAARAEKRAAQELAHNTALGRYQEALSQQSAWTARSRQTLDTPFRGDQWQRDQSFAKRMAAEVETRRQEVGAATDSLASATTAEREARDALVRARQELEILEKDRAAFEKKERIAAERREEAEAEDLTVGRWDRK